MDSVLDCDKTTTFVVWNRVIVTATKTGQELKEIGLNAMDRPSAPLGARAALRRLIDSRNQVLVHHDAR
jgi:hypothetical protein